ncbi:Protein SLG1 [Elasticomyces elasticus]|nr:Protein SLG1 [Elasticomyces elasticus]KAK4990843.1 Protein SLG1 [Elasticomyces elasticus]
MLSTLAIAYAISLLLSVLATSSATVIIERAAAPSSSFPLNAMSYQGCYSSSEPLSDQGSFMYQTSGHCQPICVGLGNTVMGLSSGSDCWCGALLPPADSKVDNSKCNSPCNGYKDENCGGGNNYWSVYLTGLNKNPVPNYNPGSSASVTMAATTIPPSSSTTASAHADSTTIAPSIVTSVAPGQTIVVTLPAGGAAASTETASTKQKSSGGPNVAGIVAGVIVGVLFIVLIAGGLFFFARHRRRKQALEESKSHQVQEFAASGKSPWTGQSRVNDSRLDPEAVMQRRASDGSIADNQDYSRRILQVTNPDGR